MLLQSQKKYPGFRATKKGQTVAAAAVSDAKFPPCLFQEAQEGQDVEGDVTQSSQCFISHFCFSVTHLQEQKGQTVSTPTRCLSTQEPNCCCAFESWALGLLLQTLALPFFCTGQGGATLNLM